MSLSVDRATVARLQKEINKLQRRQSDEMKKVAQAMKNMNSAMASASRASSPLTAKNYVSTADREAKNLETAQDRVWAVDVRERVTLLGAISLDVRC